MAQYFILVKNKNAKSWSRAIPSRPNATLTKVKAAIKKFPKGLRTRVISKTKFYDFLRRKSKSKRFIRRRK